MYSGLNSLAFQLIGDMITSLVCSKRKNVDMLFNTLDGELSTTNPEVGSASETSFISYNEESEIQISPAPGSTRCTSKFSEGGNGGIISVDILNSLSNLTSNIINSATQAAAVILPPVTYTLGNLVGQWLSPDKTPQNSQQLLVTSSLSGGQIYPGQWVPPRGQIPPEQWVPPGDPQHAGQWAVPLDLHPPGPWVQRGGQQSIVQWVLPEGKQYPGQWVPLEGQQSSSSSRQWMPSGGQHPHLPHPPVGNWGNEPWGHQFQNQSYPPAPDVNMHVGVIDSANHGYPLASCFPTVLIKTPNNSQPVNQSPQNNWVCIPEGSKYPNQSYPHGHDGYVHGKTTARGSNENATVGNILVSSSPASLRKTQNISRFVSPPLAKSSLTRNGTRKVSKPFSPDLYPAVHKCYQDIHKNLQNICIDV